MGLLIAVATLVKVMQSGREARVLLRNLRHPVSLFAMLFALWSLTTALWAPHPPWTMLRISTYSALFIMMQAIGLLDKGAVRKMWLFLLVGGALSVPLGFILPAPTDLVAASGRFTSGGKDPNDYANLVVVAVAVAAYGLPGFRGQTVGKFQMCLSYLSGLLSLLAILLSLSRTAIINIAAATFVALLFAKTRRSCMRIAVVAVVLISIVFMLFPELGEKTNARMSTLRMLGQEDTWAGRIDLWRAAVRVFIEHPIGGVGAGNFAFVSPELSYYARRIAATREDGGGGVAHNVFLSVLSETGLVGFVVFGALLLCAYVSAWRLMKRGEDMGYALFLGLIAYTIAGLTLTWEYVKISSLLYGSLLALQRVGTKHEKS